MKNVAHRRGHWRRNWTYYSRGAAIFPDGSVKRWSKTENAHGEVTIRALHSTDLYLNGENCGAHVHVSGRDKTLVDEAYKRLIAEAVAQQDGVCHSPHKHRGAIDGVTIFKVNWMEARHASSGTKVDLQCYPFFEHDFREVSETSRSCKRCSCFEMALTAYYTFGDLLQSGVPLQP